MLRSSPNARLGTTNYKIEANTLFREIAAH
jgi:hypothetical protein